MFSVCQILGGSHSNKYNFAMYQSESDLKVIRNPLWDGLDGFLRAIIVDQKIGD